MLWHAPPSSFASLPHARPCQRARVCCHASAVAAVDERRRLGDALFFSLADAAASAVSTPGLLSFPLVDARADSVPFSVSLLLGGAGLGEGTGRGCSPLGQRTLTFLLHGVAQLAHGAVRTRLEAGDALSSPSGSEALHAVAGAVVRDGWAFAALQFAWPGGDAGTSAVLEEPAPASRGGPALGAEAVSSLFRHATAALCVADASRPPGGAAGMASVSGGEGAIHRPLAHAEVFLFPGQTNRLALLFDPLGDAASGMDSGGATFGVEVFEAGHITPRHLHEQAHELFLILDGEGTAHCDEHSRAVGPGDCVVFPPHSVHGLDVVAGGASMLVLELMLPDAAFAAYVRSGTHSPEGLLPACCVVEDWAV